MPRWRHHCTALQPSPCLTEIWHLIDVSELLCDCTERMWHCVDQGTTSKRQDLVIINGTSNYGGATSKGPAQALALFIIYEAGLQLQPSKAFNWLIAPSAAQKQKSKATSEPHRGPRSDEPCQSASLIPLSSRICGSWTSEWKTGSVSQLMNVHISWQVLEIPALLYWSPDNGVQSLWQHEITPSLVWQTSIIFATAGAARSILFMSRRTEMGSSCRSVQKRMRFNLHFHL